MYTKATTAAVKFIDDTVMKTLKALLCIAMLASMVTLAGCSKEKKCDCVTTIYTSPVIRGDHILTVIEDGECSDLNETTYDQWLGRAETRCHEVPMNTQYVIDGGSIRY